jgi:hypothetical protein
MSKTGRNIYNNSAWFFLLLFGLVFIGFYKSYFSIFPNYQASVKSSTVIHFHAAVTFLWVVLLFVQPFLIRYKKYRLHKLIGKGTYVLAPLIFLSFVGLIGSKYQEANMRTWPIGEVLGYFYFQLLHTIFFATFYILAVYYRYKGKISLHSGYMIGTGLIFINPIVRRVFFNAAGLSFTISETIALFLTDAALVTMYLLAKKYNMNNRYCYTIMMMFAIYQVPMCALIYYYRPG